MAASRASRSAFLAGPMLVVALAVGLALAGCGRGGGTEHAPERGDRAVAKVDGQTLWSSDVKREAVSQGLIGEGEPLDVSSDLFRRVLDEVVDQRLLAGEAVRRKLDKDPVAGRRLVAARDRVLGDMLVESVVSDAVNDNAVRGLYQEQLKLAKRSEEIHARQIVVATAAEGEAVRKLLASGASFEALAMEKSTDAATRFNGGDLGYFTIDVMPETYDAALKTAKPGQIVGPFPVEGGFAVVKVEPPGRTADHAGGRPAADRALPDLRSDPRPLGEAAGPRQGRGDGQDRHPCPGGPTSRCAPNRRPAGRRAQDGRRARCLGRYPRRRRACSAA